MRKALLKVADSQWYSTKFYLNKDQVDIHVYFF